MAVQIDRRRFLTAAGGGLLSLSALDRLAAQDAVARHGSRSEPYGPLRRTRDQRGVEVLALPAGFSYVTFSHTGSRMSDGNTTPLALDGMAAFPGRRRGEVRLIRNSEDRNPAGQGSVQAPAAAKYDPDGGGGTVTLVFDEQRRRLVADWVSLAGTTVNCAGGIGPYGRSWLTGEETVRGPDATSAAERFSRRHGYLFETPLGRGPGEPPRGEPIRAAGRFSHEAAAVDDRRGIVYETEDPGSGLGAGFYRYIPDDFPDLHGGGRLQMLAVRGRPKLDMREGQRRGRPLQVEWVDIDEPDPDQTAVGDPRRTFNQGYEQGGALFNRLEGCWEEKGTIFFISTSGGDVKNGDVNSDGYAEGFGQVWAYHPGHRDGGHVWLVYESPSGTVLDSPDNMTVTPRGGLLMCEDDASSAFVDTHPLAPGIENVNRLVGLTHRGYAFEFAVNVLNGSELAGVCFSPSTPDAVRQPVRPRALRRGPRRRHDVRDHRAVAEGAAVGGSVVASARAASANSGSSTSARWTLVTSATAPSAVASSPPIPIASPSVMPEARPSRPGRYSWPITTVTENGPSAAIPIAASTTTNGAVGTCGSASSSSVSGIIEATSTGLRPTRSASRPPISVPIAPATSSTVQRRRGGCRARPVALDQVDRDERLEGEERRGAGDGRAREAAERPPRRRLPRGVRADRRRALRPGEPRALERQPRRDEQPRDGEQRRRAEPEGRDDERDEQRAEREAGVAADREQAHATRAGRSGDAAREPRALGVERGDPEAADRERSGERREALEQADRRRARPRRARRPPGISHGEDRRSASRPKSGCTIEEPSVAAVSRAAAAVRLRSRPAIRNGSRAGTAPWH